MLNSSAPASKQTKYALAELERRFLLSSVPDEPVQRLQLEDRYVRDTRLRLRRMQAEDGELTYKLTQKVPAPAGGPGLITTIYIDATEYRTLAALPADVLRKERLKVPPFAVDLFEGPFLGLVIGEVEFDTEVEMNAYRPPPEIVIREITGDTRLTCAALAAADQSHVRDVMAAAGP